MSSSPTFNPATRSRSITFYSADSKFATAKLNLVAAAVVVESKDGQIVDFFAPNHLSSVGHYFFLRLAMLSSPPYSLVVVVVIFFLLLLVASFSSHIPLP